MTEVKVAFLGPTGSFSEFALRSVLSEVDPLPCFSIRKVFQAVAEGAAPVGFVPLENLIEGPVTETLDLLRSYGGSIVIDQAAMASVRHAVGIFSESGAPPPDTGHITQVLSHAQALRQCSQTLETIFPQAVFSPTPSTSQAVDQVRDQRLSTAAAVAPKETLLKAGFTILADDASDSPGNKTRFVFIRRESLTLPSGLFSPLAGPTVTSFALHPRKDRKGLLYDMLTLISVEHGINLIGLHSRPDAAGGFVFYFDLEGAAHDNRVGQCLERLREYCAAATGSTAELIVFGSYPYIPFASPPFSSVGILGGHGQMGGWFQQLFSAAGLTVSTFDSKADSTARLAEFLAPLDVLLISVPMSAVPEVARTLPGALKPGTLVVENCSIKAASLPFLEASLGSDTELLGMHTMFGPSAESLKDQNVILTATSRSGPKARAFEDFLYKHGARITHCSAEEHDRMTAGVQAVFQMQALALLALFNQLAPSESELSPFVTPNVQSFLEASRRIVSQTDSLLQELQLLNPQAVEVRREYVRLCEQLVSDLEAGHTAAMDQFLSKGRELLGTSPHNRS